MGLFGLNPGRFPPQPFRQICGASEAKVQRGFSRGKGASREFPNLKMLTTPAQIVFTDDYMPMAINSLEEYEKVVNVSWFAHDKATQELT